MTAPISLNGRNPNMTQISCKQRSLQLREFDPEAHLPVDVSAAPAVRNLPLQIGANKCSCPGCPICTHTCIYPDVWSTFFLWQCVDELWWCILTYWGRGIFSYVKQLGGMKVKCKCWTKELEEPGWELVLAQKGALKAEGVQNTPPGGCRSLSTSQHPPETISAPSLLQELLHCLETWLRARKVDN